MNRMMYVCAVATALTTVAAPALAANLITNGDFELGTTPAAGSALVFGGGSSGIAGWNVTGPIGNAVDLLNTSYHEANATFGAESGVVSLDLTGAGNTGPTSGVNQNVATTPGRSYTLSFWVGNQDGSGNSLYLLPSTDDLSINGGPLTPYTNANVSHFMVNWQHFTTTFVASSATTNIAFFNGTPRSDDEAGLDNVSLTATVPEPASWALMFVGFAGLGAVLRFGSKPANMIV